VVNDRIETHLLPMPVEAAPPASASMSAPMSAPVSVPVSETPELIGKAASVQPASEAGTLR
jgi:hypothetical protein